MTNAYNAGGSSQHRSGYTLREGLTRLAAQDLGLDPDLAAAVGDDARAALNLVRRARDTADPAARADFLDAAAHELRNVDPGAYGRFLAQVDQVMGEIADTGQASINPATGAPEFAVWDGLKRLFGSADGPQVNDSDVTPTEQDEARIIDNAELSNNERDVSRGSGALLGIGVHAAHELETAGADRELYKRRVWSLDPADTRGREREKDFARERSTRTARDWANWIRPDHGPRQGSVGRANVTNPAVDRAIAAGQIVGRGALVGTAALGSHRIMTATDPYREAAGVFGSLAGGGIGMSGGAALGSWIPGPGTLAGGIAGAAAGGEIGENVGYYLYDELARRFRR